MKKMNLEERIRKAKPKSRAEIEKAAEIYNKSIEEAKIRLQSKNAKSENSASKAKITT